ncbi:hypothetical protein GCM10009416_05650 [Craurococcus roseus]|uniref:Restriction endonuclease domain-containing protein n=1 Tax=Craurococcus roseus TaxID=77585 RepID=A0ABP3PNI3_9PROT
MVNCGCPLAPDVAAVPHPAVVVEVLSPSTRSVGTGAKLADCLGMLSVRHHLILRADRPQVIHHRRSDDGAGIESRVLVDGSVRFDPLGSEFAIADFYPEDRSRGAVSGSRA